MSPSLSELKKPLPLWAPKAWYYATVRAGLNFGALFSKGLAIGQRHGFDSGVMLNHVYENKAKGVGFLGRFIDRQYLNSIGWVGIRNRGELLSQTIKETLQHYGTLRDQVNFADLACGGGRYALHAMKNVSGIKINATLRDYADANIRQTRENAQALDLSPRIEKADAFNAHDLETMDEQDVLVVSGLHEIIDDDELIRHHFKQLKRVLKPDGTLILTIQPDHPQLEFIARTLKTHTGRPWAMRLRNKDLITEWLNNAGFEIRSIKMETTGIFGIITAQQGA